MGKSRTSSKKKGKKQRSGRAGMTNSPTRRGAAQRRSGRGAAASPQEPGVEASAAPAAEQPLRVEAADEAAVDLGIALANAAIASADSPTPSLRGESISIDPWCDADAEWLSKDGATFDTSEEDEGDSELELDDEAEEGDYPPPVLPTRDPTGELDDFEPSPARPVARRRRPPARQQSSAGPLWAGLLVGLTVGFGLGVALAPMLR
ncbi:MAG: hypothetical protein AAF628_04275 [Planctomycetota bacterium]